MAALAQLSTIVIDSADPVALAGFYRKATGWDVTYSDDTYVYLGNNGPVQLGFQKIEDHKPAAWPSADKHMHLDLKVADLETTTKELLALGATKPAHQPGGDSWWVLADPEGNVFCINTGS